MSNLTCNTALYVTNLASWLWPPYVIGQAIIFLPCGFFFFLLSDIAIFVLKRDVKLQLTNFFFFLSFFLAYSQPSRIGCLPYFHT